MTPNLLVKLILVVAAGLATDAAGPPRAAGAEAALHTPPFSVTPLTLESADGQPIRGWWAEVDLSWPGLEVVVTGQRDDAGAEPPDTEADAEATLTPTDRWAQQQGVALAINANYFSVLDGPGGGADVLGLSVSDGRVVSPARSFAGVHDPVLVFTDGGGARAFTPEPGFALDTVDDAVAGIGASPTVPGRGGLLVERGLNRGATARVAPQVRHPRTAAGVNRAGDRLLLVVIDGRQPEWSVGITLPELAQLMIDRGTFAAINLDGGGSSAFYYQPGAKCDVLGGAAPPPPVLNRPSDGTFRPVANHLGLRVRSAPDAAPAPNPGPPMRDPS